MRADLYAGDRFLHKALRGWVLWWYRQASGMLIAARHRQLLAATAVQAFHQHAQLRKTKYAMWRAAARQRLCTLFRGLHRSVILSTAHVKHHLHRQPLKPSCTCEVAKDLGVGPACKGLGASELT